MFCVTQAFLCDEGALTQISQMIISGRLSVIIVSPFRSMHCFLLCRLSLQHIPCAIKSSMVEVSIGLV